MAAEQSAMSAARPPPVVPLPPGGRGGAAPRAVPLGAAGARSEAAVEHFLKAGRLAARDGAEIRWWHAANSRRRTREAARSAVHMVEADVLLRGGRGGDGDPIMAHPPETDSDITLQEWLEEMVGTDKGIKLDFKSLDAVRPSLELLQLVKPCLERPVWLNADILPGPNGINTVVDAKEFLDTVTSFFPDATLSLGWTTGWHPEQHNEGHSLVLRNFRERIARALFQVVCSPSPARRGLLIGVLAHFLRKVNYLEVLNPIGMLLHYIGSSGYSWTMVQEMAQICSTLSQPVTFPVRAALVRQSVSELRWLIDQSDWYSLTVWTGKQDVYSVEDLLFIRENFDKSRVYYDISEPQNSEFKKAIGMGC